MKMILFVVSLFLTNALGSVVVASDKPNNADVQLSAVISDKSISDAKLRADLNLLAASIRSERQLKRYLKNTPKDESPIELLSPSARKRFLSSLKFNDMGITSFRHDDIQRELSVTQAYQLLSLFGAQETTRFLVNSRQDTALDKEIMSMVKRPSTESATRKPIGGGIYDDHIGYSCVGLHNCKVASQFICMTGC